MVSGVDKVVNFKNFSRSNKEIKYFSRRLLSNQPRFQARKPSCLFPSELNKIAFTAIRRRHFRLKMNGRNGRIRKTYCSKDVTYFLMRRRQRGRVVSVSDSQSGGPGFESRSGHLLDLFSVVPISNPRPRL